MYPEEGKKITPYSFKMSLIEGFRYRVEDTLRSVTRAAIKEARVKELKAEILNSRQLKEHFAENQADLKLLMEHDRTLLGQHVKPHLKSIPSYLMPNMLGATTLSTGSEGSTTGSTGINKRKRSQGKVCKSALRPATTINLLFCHRERKTILLSHSSSRRGRLS